MPRLRGVVVHRFVVEIVTGAEVGADPWAMHDPRISTVVRQPADLGREPNPPRWSWTVVRLDDKGRIVLPAGARLALGVHLGGQATVRGVCHRVGLVLWADGAGSAVVVDGRCRVCCPGLASSVSRWVARRDARHDDALLVVAAAAVLDALGDLLAGASR